MSKKLPSNSMFIGESEFIWGSRTYVMGIINVTPDSFSGDGVFQQADYVRASLEQAHRFAKAGADILDVGGESTRPGAEYVDALKEIERVVPVIEALRAELETPISIDTYKAQVAEAAIRAGAHIVNDVWGGKGDPQMAPLLAKEGLPVVLMHNRSKASNAKLQENLGGRYVGVEYEDLLADIEQELLECVQIAEEAGVAREKIILDPGIGFGKTVEQNLELVRRTNEIKALGFPLLLGSSRKSFIGYTLDKTPEQRLEGTAATVAIAIDRGADIVRVHDVEAMALVARMTDALVR